MYKIKDILKVKEFGDIDEQIKLLDFVEELEDEGYEVLSCSHLSKNNGYYSLVATVGYWKSDRDE